ncbi:MAG: [Fe-Fe] hydrogenase large subunit C-terminal domain-containing protein [Myxococcota bacterium]|jgi:signal transduction histidine kinase/Fe-S-cluster-containing hydrogenase component 2|nr:[Fe-Fe] hydrogenase large subunit C-terminal domain-containing protein [Myxococcota bacterium]
MTLNEPPVLVTTVRKRCRMCYTCVRECPVKAIRIADGQAKVVSERCIGCGNCIRVCSQNAKQMVSTVDQVAELLDGDERLIALIAPSFPAEFPELHYQQLIGMIRMLGFDKVCDVAFGADLVARRYRSLLSERKRYITTSCPAVVATVERYYPQLVGHLAPIVSPMVASARALRHKYGADFRVVFIGPCIAKKGESVASEVAGEIDAVITFLELRQLFLHRRISANSVTPSDFDPPIGRLGGIFPLQGGELQAAKIQPDLLADEVVNADGHKTFISALRAFDSGQFSAKLLDVICCEGCIMGQGMSSNESAFVRRSRVSNYVRQRMTVRDEASWEADLDGFAELDLSRDFFVRDQRIDQPTREEIEEILRKMGKLTPSDELNCGACGYETCREHAVAIFKGLAESEMCLPFTIESLHRSVSDLHESHAELASTQQALMHSERLASMGQLAACIAHEINNPLGVVIMYAHLLQETSKPDDPATEDLAMIAREADRCKKIVAGLLNFARQNKVLRSSSSVPALLQSSADSAPPPPHISLELDAEMRDPSCEMDLDQMIQVIVNLLRNAYDAMPQGGKVRLIGRDAGNNVQIAVQDNGVGITEEHKKRLFEPFFTTKAMGKGTGLGLPTSYGIVKMHRGQIQVDSNADPNIGPTGTTFTITIPRHNGS